MKKTGLIGLIALGLFGLTAPASAYVIAIDAPNSFTLAALGSGPNNSFVSGAAGSVGAISYSFTGGAPDPSGIYAGSVTNIAASPYPDASTRYFSAEGGGGTATLTYNDGLHTVLNMLWGTVNSSATRNLITTSGGQTITGDDIRTACGATCIDGVTNVWVTISGLNAFNQLVFSDATANAFEFNVQAVPELSTWGMMILGFFGLGFIGYRKSKASGAAFRLA